MTKKEKEELKKMWDKITFVVEPKKSTIISNKEMEERKKNRKKIYKTSKKEEKNEFIKIQNKKADLLFKN